MRQIGLWTNTQPSEQAMASQQPFACDQMDFPEWLQYLFIPRLFLMIEQEVALPSNSDIASMAEVYFAQKDLNATEIIETIRQIDQLLRNSY